MANPLGPEEHPGTRRVSAQRALRSLLTRTSAMMPYDVERQRQHRQDLGYGITSKQDLVRQLLKAKSLSGKTFSQLGKELGVTNLYAAQLFHNQAQLSARTAPLLKKAVPDLSTAMIAFMQQPPMRSYDPAITQEPHIYRLTEAVLHYGESIKAVMNEELGDGIMSAIDMYSDVKIIEGKNGEKRVCLTLNGKFLPHVEQLTEDNTAPQ